MADIAVLQADRERAADVVKSYRGTKNGDWQGRIRRGEVDDGEMVQAFVRHRHDHTADLLEALSEAGLAIRDRIRAGHATTTERAVHDKITTTLSRARNTPDLTPKVKD